MNNTNYHINLIKRVIDKSINKNWKDAVLEWVIINCNEDEDLLYSCICGKENLRYLFTIQNIYNKNILYPIGSSCIKKFERADLDEKASIHEKLFKLFRSIEDGSFITLSSDFFSRKLLKYLLDEGVFQANKYNKYNPKIDFIFILKMFNKRNKNSITIKQQQKINAIIMDSIKPYLMEQIVRPNLGKTQ